MVTRLTVELGVPEAEWGDYLTDSGTFKKSLRRASPEIARTTAKNKVKFHDHCVLHGLPTIPILCVVTGDQNEASSRIPYVSSVQQWLLTLESASEEMFVKPVDGTYEVGAFSIERAGDDFRYAGQTGTAVDLFDLMRIRLQSESGLIVQPRLRTISALSSITSSNALNTVRAVTYMRDGIAKFLIADLKIVVGDNVADNFAKGASGDLLAAIETETGTLLNAWGSKRRDWPVIMTFPLHPNTGGMIKGFHLPFWDELVQLAIRAQESLPDLRAAGWDIAATDQGLMLVEANDRFDLAIIQIAHQRGLKQELDAILSS